MKKIAFATWILLLYVCNLQAQFVAEPYARKIVDTLCHSYFGGRGYVDDGDRRAAEFIAFEFNRLGLTRFPKAMTYFQNFQFPVNTFPHTVSAISGKDTLKPGIDFVPAASCPTIQGEYKLVWVDSALLSNEKRFRKFSKQRFDKTFMVMDEKGITNEETKKVFKNLGMNPYGAKGIIRIKDKITWSVATDTTTFAQLDVVRNILSQNQKSLKVDIRNRFVTQHATQNVMAYIPGKEVTDTFIVFTAHYDHLGKIGPDVIFRGANDNASGVAMMLSLAKYFSENRHLCKYSIAFIAFAGEEAGLIGSKFFTMNPVFPLKNIRLLVNVDLMGGGEDGITVVNAKENPRIFNLMKSINDELQLLKAIKERSNAPNSDHYYFAEAGVPAIFIYTMGTYKHYHDVNDRAENLQLTKFNQVFTLITELIKRY
jgi:hypothetical protein